MTLRLVLPKPLRGVFSLKRYLFTSIALQCLLIVEICLSAGTTLTNPVQDETETIATATIEEATTSLLSAFEEVRKADKAGAKVDRLINDLNDAERHLGTAIIAKEKDQFATAIAEARATIEITEKAEQKAKELRKEAEQGRFLQWVLIPFAIVGLVAAGIFAWRWLKPRLDRQAERELLKTHIEY